MDKYTDFSDYGIDIKNKTSGQIYTTCPRCSHERKKKTDPCLSVNISEGVWLCHHCGWKGSINNHEPLTTWANKTTISNDVVEWFAKRNISQETLSKMGISEGVEWMPQTQKNERVICFPYFRDGKLTNTKYRTLEGKHFKLTKGAPLLPYNIDGIKDQETVHIVEGEIDALTLIGLGITNTISVPNGANNNLVYLDLKYFETVSTIAICTDDDEPGNKLAEDIADKLGRERCARVKFAGYKDLNEMYCKEGNIDNVSKEPFTKTTSDTLPSREQLRMTLKYVKKNKYPALTLRQSTLINFGEIFAIAGHPGMGKTTIIDGIICAYLSGEQYFQFRFNRGNGKKVLIMDTERPPDDVSNSHHNIAKRLSTPKLDDQGEIDSLVHLVVSEFGKVGELKSILERELSTNEFDLVVLDGILDFSQSMNDDKDATDVVKWVRALAVKHNCAVVVTIHPNKGTDTIAGHLGSFLYRYCRAILFVRSVQGDKSVRELTGEPDMAKLSHADKNILEPIYFKWDNGAYLMTECSYTPKETRGKADKMQELMTGVLSEQKMLRYSDLVNALVNNGTSKGTAKRWITDSTDCGLLVNRDGVYQLNINHV